MADEKKANYLKGASILAATVAITKVIGAVYKVPLFNLLGDEGTTHFQVTYYIYNLLLTISTAGIPVALSRLISAARATDRPLQVRRYYHVGMGAFMTIGALGMLLMLLFAQQLADFMGDYEVAGGVKCLAPAVLFACVISVFRGYSQGHNDMVPTAISQIMEVLCKLVFGLAIAWYLSSRGYGSAAISAGAIVGVTIGLGLAIPIVGGRCRKITRRFASDTVTDIPDSVKDTLVQVLKISIPITLGSSILNIINLIDSKLVLERLQSGAGFSYTDAKILFGVYSKGQSLFAIPSSFITPVAVAVVPVIAAALARRDAGEARRMTESSIKLTNLVAMPAAVGLCVLARPIIDTLYYGSNENGPRLLAVLGIASFFVCAYIITNGILQASGHEKLALLTLPIGGVVKVVVNWVLVGSRAVNIMGAPIGTLACYLVITVLNVVFIVRKLPEKPDFLKITVRPALCAVIMGAAAWGVYGVASRLLAGVLGTGRLGIAACTIVAVAAAVAVYFVLAVVLRAVTREDMALISGGEKLADKLHIR